MGIRLYVGKEGALTDIRPWMDKAPTQQSAQALGDVSTMTFEVLGDDGTAGNGTLPIQPTGGDIVVFYNHNANPLLHEYYFVGKIVQIVKTPTVEDKRWVIKAQNFDHELNHMVPYIEWNGSDFPNDQDRLFDLFINAGMATNWDTSLVAGPFVNFPDEAVPYSRRSVWDIVQDIAAWPGVDTDPDYPVAARRVKVSATFDSPSSPATSTITRYLEYYSGATTGWNNQPLTDKPREMVAWIADQFPNNANPLDGEPVQLGNGTWLDLNGDWRSVSGIAKHNGSGNASYPRATVVSGFDGDKRVEASPTIVQVGWGVCARVQNLGAGAWSGFYTRWTGTATKLYRLQAGTPTEIGTYTHSFVPGDIVGLGGLANVITVQINGVTRIAVSDSFNNTQNLFGICATFGDAAGATWDNFYIKGRGIPTIGKWRQDEDWSGMINIMPIAGPGSDPALVKLGHQVGTSSDDDFIVKAYDPGAWTVATITLAGTWRRPTTHNDRQYISTNSGTTHATTEPNWATALNEGQTVNDNGIVWECRTWNSGGYSEDPQQVTEDGAEVEGIVAQAVIAVDSFGREDSIVGLDAAEKGGEWTPVALTGAQTWGIMDQQAYLVAATGTGVNLLELKASTGIPILKLPVMVFGNGLAIRWNSAGTKGLAVVPESGAWKLYKYDSPTWTQLQTWAGTPANNDEVKVSMHNGTVEVYINGTLRMTDTSGFCLGCTRHGLATKVASTVARYDNFSFKSGYGARAYGFTSSAAPSINITNIKYGVRLDSSRVAYPVVSGAIVGGSPISNYSDGQRYKCRVRLETLDGIRAWWAVWTYITTDGFTHEWYRVQITGGQEPSTASPYFVLGVIYHNGGALSGITLLRYTFNLFRADEAVPGYDMAEYGEWPAKKTLVDDKLDTYAKRLARFVSIIMKHGYPRVTWKGVTLTGITSGYRTIIYNSRLGWTPEIRIAATVQRDWSTKNPQKPRWVLTMGDSEREYGDDEPVGFLTRGSVLDRVAPGPPVGFDAPAALAGEDTPSTVYQTLTWTENGGDTKSYDIYVRQVADPNDYRQKNITAGAGKWTAGGLKPFIWYYAKIRANDYNGNVGAWSNTISFRTVDLVTEVPTSFGHLRHTWGKNGTANITLGWVRAAEPFRTAYELQHRLDGEIWGRTSFNVGREATSFTINGVAVDANYVYRIRTIVYDPGTGLWRRSKWVQITYSVPSMPDFDIVGQKAWTAGPADTDGGIIPNSRINTQSAGVTATIETTDLHTYQGQQVLKVVLGNGQILDFQSLPFPVTELQEAWAFMAAINLVNATTTFTGEVIFQDASGATVGSPLGVLSGSLGTVWANNRNTLAHEVPATAVKAYFHIHIVGNAPSGGTCYVAYPDYGDAWLREQVFLKLDPFWFYEGTTQRVFISSDSLLKVINIGVDDGGVGDYDMTLSGGLAYIKVGGNSGPALIVNGEAHQDLLILTAGGVEQFKVDRSGNTTIQGTLDVVGNITTPNITASNVIYDVPVTSPITSTGGQTPNIGILAASGLTRGTQSTAHYNLVQNATDANTASAIVKRDASGRVKLTDPSASSDAATKNYVDTSALLKSLGTTKGDLVAFSASATPARLGVGSNDTILTADSGQTLGMKWATSLNLSGAGAFGGDLTTNASGGTTGTPRIIGLTNLGAARFQFGDEWNSIQNASGYDLQIQSYWPTEIYGNRQTTSTSLPFVTSDGGGPSLRVIGSQNSSSVLVLKGSGSQSGPYLECLSALGGAIAKIDSAGKYFIGANQVLGPRKTGWAVATGTATRTTFDTATVTLPLLAQRVKALIDDFHATAGHGFIGT